MDLKSVLEVEPIELAGELEIEVSRGKGFAMTP